MTAPHLRAPAAPRSPLLLWASNLPGKLPVTGDGCSAPTAAIQPEQAKAMRTEAFCP